MNRAPEVGLHVYYCLLVVKDELSRFSRYNWNVRGETFRWWITPQGVRRLDPRVYFYELPIATLEGLFQKIQNSEKV